MKKQTKYSILSYLGVFLSLVLPTLGQNERLLIADPLHQQTTGKPQGAGEFMPDGGWRSKGGRIVYDAGEAIEKGYFEATVRGVTLPAQAAAKSNIITAWESGEPFKSGKEKGANWMLRIGTSCHIKLLAFSDNSSTRIETNVDKYTIQGEPHRFRIAWSSGKVVYTIDGQPLGEFQFARMSVRYFVIGIDNSFSDNALTNPAPIISDIKLVNLGEPMPQTPAPTESVARYGVFEKSFKQPTGEAKSLTAKVTFWRHGGGSYTIPLFEDGNGTARFRFSPDAPGRWTWRVEASNPSLDGQTGVFTCLPSELRGGVIAKGHAPGRELTYQNGQKYWLLGDTQWTAFEKNTTENLDFQSFKKYIDQRAQQGFTFLQTALLAGGTNEGGTPFLDKALTQPNPAYWQEVDKRVQYLNQRGITPLLALAWGGESKESKGITWDDFGNDAARQRYAQYIVARYAAYNVAFAVAADWNTTDSSPARIASMNRLGTTIQQADPHHRWITILGDASRESGSVSRFATESWMTFSDFRNSAENLYIRNFGERNNEKITVHGGFLKISPTTTIDDARHALWDVVMAGNYPIMAFADTEWGGQHTPAQFNGYATSHATFLRQLELMRHFFEEVAPRDNSRGEWSWIKPFHRSFRGDTLIKAPQSRTTDRANHRPPAVMHGVLAKEGKGFTAVVYMRGQATPHTLRILHDPLDPTDKLPQRVHSVHRYNPRTGEYIHQADLTGILPTLTLTPPDAQDWVFVVQRKNIFDPLAQK
ncbi:MAG: DUF4038 domain-containing protein [Runella sp.]